MRQQQQRSRNRNRGRKSSNPLSKNFESNGPDVKIRGNANHIAEKYSVLARDAQTSGDTVMAENYFQHAEHYFRIVANAQQNNPQNNAQNNVQGGKQTGEGTRDNQNNDKSDAKGEGPQPEMSEVPAEVGLKPDNRAAVQENSEKPGDGAEKEDRGKNRRNGRRPASNRRTSRVSSAQEEPATSDKPDIDPDGLSKDAASLPSGLIGKSEDDKNLAATSDE